MFNFADALRPLLTSKPIVNIARFSTVRQTSNMALADVKTRRRKDYKYHMEYRTRWYVLFYVQAFSARAPNVH